MEQFTIDSITTIDNLMAADQWQILQPIPSHDLLRSL